MLIHLQAAEAVQTTGAQPDPSLPALPPSIGGVSVVEAPGLISIDHKIMNCAIAKFHV